MRKWIITLVALFSVISAGTAIAGSSLDRILKNGELVIATTGSQPPMTATTKKGEIIGMDADIARAMAESLGVKIKFVPMPFTRLIPALESGKVDMILSGMTMTPERNQKVAFIGPYYVSGKGILAVADKYAAMKEAKGLNTPEVTVVALKNSTSEKYAEDLMPKATLKPAESYDTAIALLFDGKADVMIADFPFCALTAYRYNDKGLIAGGSPLSFEPLGVAMAEDTLLINWVQNFLGMLQGTGRLKEIQKKWMNGGSWVEDLR